MFADDLIFFAKTEDNKCRVVMDILNTFCSHSGQKVNFQKSKFYISPNVDHREAANFNHIWGMVSIKDLGTYLGVPLIHGRVRNNHFDFIINKM